MLNALLAAMCLVALVAALLAPGVSRLTRVPRLRDITTMSRMLEVLGATVVRDGEQVVVPTREVVPGDADVISDIYRKRVVNRGASVLDWGVNYDKASIRATKGLRGKASS